MSPFNPWKWKKCLVIQHFKIVHWHFHRREEACECDRLIVQQFNRVMTSHDDGSRLPTVSCYVAIYNLYSIIYNLYPFPCWSNILWAAFRDRHLFIQLVLSGCQKRFSSNVKFSWCARNTPTTDDLRIRRILPQIILAWQQWLFDWRCPLKTTLAENEPSNSFLLSDFVRDINLNSKQTFKCQRLNQ